MKRKWLLAVLAATAAPLLSLAPWPAQAFECPAYFAEAQAAIDKASAQIKHPRGGMPMAAISHLRHARMSLVEARFHHTQPGAFHQNFHHARAIVRAYEARGHAVTAEILSRALAKP